MSLASSRQSWPDRGLRRSAQERVDALEDSLIQGIAEDDRLGNGVPARHRAGNIDFVLMSGLTAPAPQSAPLRKAPPARTRDLDPEVPVSFFEKGISDVDSSVGPRATELAATEDDELIVTIAPPRPAESKTASSLMDIIAELTGETPQPFPEDGPDIALEDQVGPMLEPEFTKATVSAPDYVGPVPVSEVRPPDTEAGADGGVPATASDLAQAGRLVHALESTEVADPGVGIPAERRYLSGWSFPEQEDPEDVYDEGDDRESEHSPSSRRRSGGSNVRRRLIRWGFRTLALMAFVAGLYQAYTFYELRTATDFELYAAAERSAKDGAYLDAADRFLQLMRNYPESALHADAQFMAAYALQQVSQEDGDIAESAYADAVLLFEQFIQAYPGHEKRARAQTLLGTLYYKTGDYRNAVSMLSRPERRERDPGAYLPTLRTLARSYAMLGEIEHARSAFLRAATLEDNLAPDRDYIELAELYKEYADRSQSPETRAAYLERAIAQWEFALSVPSLLTTRKREIRSQRDAIVHEMNRLGYDAPAFVSADRGLRHPD